NPLHATRAPRLTKADGIVDWSLPAVRIERMQRAMDPWPRIATFLSDRNTGHPPLRLVLEDVDVAEVAETASNSRPGTVLAVGDHGIVVACGEGTSLVIRRLVPEGRRSMSAAEFLRGHSLLPGAILGSGSTE
ncbi:MAG: methionyl-tRNA formyltransferase, partial [Planctomycetota bacterium]